MIDWIAGGIIAVVTLIIIVRMVRRYSKGEGGCCDGCPGADQNRCNCSHKP